MTAAYKMKCDIYLPNKSGLLFLDSFSNLLDCTEWIPVEFHSK